MLPSPVNCVRMKVKFRLTIEYLKNIDVVPFLNQYGTGLFLVLHEKPQNFHYHGLLDLTVCVKTFRKQLNSLLCEDAMLKCPKGMRPISLSDKVNDENGYKAYCCYRTGHPITNVVVNDNLEELSNTYTNSQKSISSKSCLKLESDLHEIQPLIPPGTGVRQITRVIIKYYHDKNRIIHIANIRQLVWSIFSIENPNALIDHILSEENLWQYETRREIENRYKVLTEPE